MASRLDHVPPEELAIHKYLKLKDSPEPHPAEERLIQRFEACLAALDFQDRLRELRLYALEAFGTVPPPGPDRGDYFITLKKNLSDINPKLVQVALSDKPFNTDIFLKLFEKFTITELLTELDVATAGLKEQRIGM
jgi:hypothetical protein